jgi:hypothetical protein
MPSTRSIMSLPFAYIYKHLHTDNKQAYQLMGTPSTRLIMYIPMACCIHSCMHTYNKPTYHLMGMPSARLITSLPFAYIYIKTSLPSDGHAIYSLDHVPSLYDALLTCCTLWYDIPYSELALICVCMHACVCVCM